MQLFFDNFVPKKPENKREGISPNYNNPQKGYALPGAKRFLSGSLGFLLLSPGRLARLTVVARYVRLNGNARRTPSAFTRTTHCGDT